MRRMTCTQSGHTHRMRREGWRAGERSPALAHAFYILRREEVWEFSSSSPVPSGTTQPTEQAELQ